MTLNSRTYSLMPQHPSSSSSVRRRIAPGDHPVLAAFRGRLACLLKHL